LFRGDPSFEYTPAYDLAYLAIWELERVPCVVNLQCFRQSPRGKLFRDVLGCDSHAVTHAAVSSFFGRYGFRGVVFLVTGMSALTLLFGTGNEMLRSIMKKSGRLAVCLFLIHARYTLLESL
jgi:hypothetical protein